MILTRMFSESLTGDNGRFSSKKLTMASYSTLGLLMIISDMIYNHGRLNYEAFVIVIGMSLGNAIIGVTDKKLNDTDNQPITPSTTTKTDISIEKIES